MRPRHFGIEISFGQATRGWTKPLSETWICASRLSHRHGFLVDFQYGNTHQRQSSCQLWILLLKRLFHCRFSFRITKNPTHSQTCSNITMRKQPFALKLDSVFVICQRYLQGQGTCYEVFLTVSQIFGGPVPHQFVLTIIYRLVKCSYVLKK